MGYILVIIKYEDLMIAPSRVTEVGRHIPTRCVGASDMLALQDVEDGPESNELSDRNEFTDDVLDELVDRNVDNTLTVARGARARQEARTKVRILYTLSLLMLVFEAWMLLLISQNSRNMVVELSMGCDTATKCHHPIAGWKVSTIIAIMLAVHATHEILQLWMTIGVHWLQGGGANVWLLPVIQRLKTHVRGTAAMWFTCCMSVFQWFTCILILTEPYIFVHIIGIMLIVILHVASWTDWQHVLLLTFPLFVIIIWECLQAKFRNVDPVLHVMATGVFFAFTCDVWMTTGSKLKWPDFLQYIMLTRHLRSLLLLLMFAM